MSAVSALGVLLTQWTIRLALACFAVYLAGGIAPLQHRWPRASRWIWTTGCGLFVVHVVCAFHFYHHWSHAAAWEATAHETKQLLGVAFGDGIYFSYLFLVLWILDVIWLWLPESRLPGSARAWPRQSATGVPPLAARAQGTPHWRVLVHIFLFFIAFNGAIVFEAGPTRWAGIVACCVLAALAGLRGYNTYVQSPSQPAREMVHKQKNVPSEISNADR